MSKADEILEQVADRWAARDGYDPGSAVYLKDTRFMARTIAEELGLSEDHVDELGHAALDCEAASRHDTAELVRHVAAAISVLLAMGETNDG